MNVNPHTISSDSNSAEGNHSVGVGARFVHLHTHSHYSLLDGLSKVKDMVKLAKAYGQTAIGLTDHGVMYGAIDFYTQCKKNDIKPIIGCLPPGHLIYTIEGMKPIEDIRAGDLVLTHKGRFKKVTNTMSRKHTGKLYGVNSSNSNIVWMTEEHPVLVTNTTSKEHQWIRADQLQFGRKTKKGGLKSWKQYAVFPKLKEEIKNELNPLDYLDRKIYGQIGTEIKKTAKYNKYDSLQDLSLPSSLPVSANLARFFGLFLAEGSFQHDLKGRPTTLSFAFEESEDDFINSVSQVLSSLSPNGSAIYHRPERHLKELNHSNTILSRYVSNLTKKGAEAKRIPPPAFNWSPEYLKVLLQGISEGDGKINSKTGQITIRVKSRDLAWGAKLLAASLGYPGKVTKSLEGINKEKTIYNFSYCPTGKYKRVLEDENYLYLPIKEVQQKSYSGLVYNFTVEDDNSYVSDVTLHNCEVYVANRSRLQKEPHIDNRRYHLTLLAKDNIGYQNLIKLITAAHIEGYYYKPRVDKELLKQYAEGLICLSGCPGSELGRTIQGGDLEKAEQIIREHQAIFGPDNYYMEIMCHPDIDWYPQWKSAIVGLSRKLNIPLVATQDSHYLRPDDKFAHKTLVAISTQTDVTETAIFSGNGEYHFLSTAEAAERFADIPEAVENTIKVAERCNVDLTLGKFIFPDFALEPGKTADQMLDELTLKGAAEKGLTDSESETRRQYELEIIKNKSYAPYFLVVADLMRFAHEQSIYSTVRGSAAGSLVAYLSGITNVNPIEFQLPFERFLNPFRPSAPDIDMDFADNRRGEIVEYAKKKYGSDKVAQIGTFGTMLARGAVRDVARALGKPYDAGDRLAKLIPMGSQGFPMTIDKAMELEVELKSIYDREPEAHQILDIAKKLEGTVRHVSVHAAGIVISPKPLTEYVPIQFDPKGEDNLITQYDMYTVGEDGVGLLKLDVLGIRNLAILGDAVRLVKMRRGIDIDIEKIPFDDKKTFEMLSRGETEGVFQLGGSEGMTKYLKELKPTSIHDLNAMVALYRPGPINNIPEYIARKHGRSPIKYFHPKAEKFLDKSYGILVYQEDLIFTAMELAGYNWETVDKFRKAVGKKIPAEMAKQHEIFVRGCHAHSGMTFNEAEAIWNLFEPFQGYGFGKAHAACYGRVAYQTAYMKANYPAEYMCAVLTAESGDTERVAEIISECQRMGIPVLPPDINSSHKAFTVIGNQQPATSDPQPTDQIRFGLLTIKNLGEAIADAIIAERQTNGPFKDAEDFVTRVQHKDPNRASPTGIILNKKSFESLAKCGAMDQFGERNFLLFNMETLLTYAHEKQKASSSTQMGLFGGVTEVALPALRLNETTPAANAEKLNWEKELLGLYVSSHPLHDYQQAFKFENVIPIKNLSARSAPVKVGGIITKIQKIITKTGRPMMFANIEDLAAKIELVVFPNVYEKNPEIWQENRIVVATGKVNDRDGTLKLLCDDVKLVTT